MSNDQKPARIKIVNGTAPARAENKASKDAVAKLPPPVPIVTPTRRVMRLSAIMFLVGCAIGGVGLAAWPHLMAG